MAQGIFRGYLLPCWLAAGVLFAGCKSDDKPKATDKPAAETAAEAAKETAGTAADKAKEAAGTATDKANEAAGTAAEKAAKALEEAAKAFEGMEDLKGWTERSGKHAVAATERAAEAVGAMVGPDTLRAALKDFDGRIAKAVDALAKAPSEAARAEAAAALEQLRERRKGIAEILAKLPKQ